MPKDIENFRRNNFEIDERVDCFVYAKGVTETEQTKKNDLDEKFIQLTKDTKSKIDEAKAKLDEHINKDHSENDIYKFLRQTKRGRFLCWMLGYKTELLRDRIILKKTAKLKNKERKIRGL